ncbi:hypothetical protein KC340_g83 [Hortaea werneckii]|nr:hypothetical protein KC340_g83 [Hortaea werneckii]
MDRASQEFGQAEVAIKKTFKTSDMPLGRVGQGKIFGPGELYLQRRWQNRDLADVNMIIVVPRHAVDVELPRARTLQSEEGSFADLLLAFVRRYVLTEAQALFCA